MEFTEEQLRAIDIGRLGQDACIVAGPGSGKTTVLVERYRQLIAGGIEPSEILAITFTEKAAANMRDRLSKQFAGDPELLRKLDRASVSTIHGFCSRLLKEYATAAGVDPEFVILDEQLAVLLQARCVRETLDAAVAEDFGAIKILLTATGGADLERQIPGLYDAMRAAGVRPAELREFEAPNQAPSLEPIVAVAKRYINGFPANPNPAQRNACEDARQWLQDVLAARSASDLLPLILGFAKAFNLRTTNSAKEDVKGAKEYVEVAASYFLDEAHAREKQLLIRIFEDFDARYRANKAERAALDFNDLEFFAVRLFEQNPAIREQVNGQFRLVMIDEFQDTSAQQSRLIDLIRAPGRFYAVGDLNQSIYSFRHASPQVFEDYRGRVIAARAHAEELVENWRSREAVLLATQRIVQDAPGITQRELVPARRFPERKHPIIDVLVLDSKDEEESYALEAAWVVHRIRELHQSLGIGEEGRSARFSDFALLVRNTGVLDPYLDALERAGIDYNLNRRSGFFETREARDLLHLLRMIHNPRDEGSTLAVLRSDFAGISDEGLLRLKHPKRNFGDALLDYPSLNLHAEDHERLERFAAGLSQWRAAASQISLDRLILRALDDMGVVWDPLSSRGINIEKFLTITRTYAEMTLGEFVAHADALRTADPRETDAPIDETRDAVQIMSTHAAKGLEFPVVILAAMDKGVDAQRSPALNFTPKHGLGVKWASSDEAEACSGLIHALNKEKIKTTEEGEANRLLYVALTRAQEHLILSWTQKEKDPRNWARTVITTLDLAGAPVSDQPTVRGYTAPNGRPFEVRVLRTAGMPPPFLMAGGSRPTTEPQVLAKPLRTDPFEANTTATALSQFASCPRKYYLSGFLGWSGTATRPRIASGDALAANSRAADIGTQVHQLLAGIPSEAPDMEALRLAKVFEKSALGKRAFQTRDRETEWEFVFALGSLIVRGTIDLWFEDAQGFTLIDYKTDSVTPEHANERASDYALQLQVYALALQKATGRLPAQAWLHFLRPDVAVPIPIGQAADAVERVAHAFTQARQTLDFPLHPGAHCRRCEFFRNLCPGKEP